MTRKFTQARKDAFLRAVADTGNQTLAAERAKVSRSWVQSQRSHDPAFRAAIEQAVAEAKAALLQGQGERDGNGAGYANGAELVVRGTGGAGGKRVQVARARVKQWSPRAEERFLETLAATCNVKAACAEVGLTAASAYNHRQRWPAFARRWDAAVELGYIMLEGVLVEAAANLYSEQELAEPGPIRNMTADQAIHLLHMHQHHVRRIGKAPGRAVRAPDPDAMRASILRKIAAIKRKRALEKEGVEPSKSSPERKGGAPQA